MYKVVALHGDGVGPEVMEASLKVLEVVSKRFNFSVKVKRGLIGGDALDKRGVPLPPDTLKLCKESDAVMLGAVGGGRWDGLKSSLRPESGLLKLRSKLGVFANLRPVRMFSQLKRASPLKGKFIKGVDLIVVRELTGGIYYGKPRGTKKVSKGYNAVNTMEYSTPQINRIAKVAFNLALSRRKKVTSVDKANVLECSQLWRREIDEISRNYPEVKLNHLYVDNCSMQLILNPTQFDIILTANLFGDILSDEASVLTGSIGMLPSASLGNGVGLFEPVHGSAPDIAGKDVANPIAAILSVAMMMRYSFGMDKAAISIENAVNEVLNRGFRTKDIGNKGEKIIGTKRMAELIAKNI